jgi:hypothetical protein
MSLNNICEYCNLSFSSKSNLNAHQKRAKKCLKTQHNNNIIFEENLFKCNFCKKNFTSQKYFNEHNSKCFEKIEKERNNFEKKSETFEKKFEKSQLLLKEKDTQIKELTSQIKDLQQKLSNIAEIGANKPTKIINNNTYRFNNIVNNLIPYDLDKDKILSIVQEKFTENYLYGKNAGIANFAINNLLKDENGNLKMRCTDISRKIFVYKDEYENIYKDPSAIKFLENYMPAVKKKSCELISDKDGDRMLELTECMISINTPNVTNKLANKLVLETSSLRPSETTS